jgi:hypothetical protein
MERVFQPDMSQPWGVHITADDVHAMPCSHAAAEIAERSVHQSTNQFTSASFGGLNRVVQQAQINAMTNFAQQQAMRFAEESARSAAMAASRLGQIAATTAALEASETALRFTQRSTQSWAAAGFSSTVRVDDFQTLVSSPEIDDAPLGSRRTCRDVAAGARTLGLQLTVAASNKRLTEAVRGEVSKWISDVVTLVEVLDRSPDRALTADERERVNQLQAGASRLRDEIRQQRQARANEDFHQAKSHAADAAARMRAMMPTLQESMRSAYRAKDRHLLRSICEEIHGATELGEILVKFVKVVPGLLDSPGGWRAAETAAVALSHVADGLKIVDMVLRASESRPGGTEAENAIHELSKAIGLLATLHQLAKLPTPLGPYLEAMVEEIEQIAHSFSQTIDALHEANVTSVHAMGLMPFPGAEPDAALHDFMSVVMRSPVAVALPPDVAEFVYDQRKLLEAGTDSEVPTRGWFWNRRVDAEEGAEWLYHNRGNVWAMLFGALREK